MCVISPHLLFWASGGKENKFLSEKQQKFFKIKFILKFFLKFDSDILDFQKMLRPKIIFHNLFPFPREPMLHFCQLRFEVVFKN
jgi:hypothetical protein